ncbi:hypothetical protein CEUSTIGMA_g7459.t1 [Chlamydomonas eustigma]|uniref:Uncharacterized protein n=1 Tax=Chlamydomonas eustigma TaxID=1157962 RepID=A0A250XB72_9CHLO|nr:hypothetical protein CEUSTIGMA_g7459.t1 [Chlamydomonas eustigma]|eukprot:GAX80020.1 hypothetical protein CEUSTIGMA_g7459.t1 [Chlamydomonas eustigma]
MMYQSSCSNHVRLQLSESTRNYSSNLLIVSTALFLVGGIFSWASWINSVAVQHLQDQRLREEYRNSDPPSFLSRNYKLRALEHQAAEKDLAIQLLQNQILREKEKAERRERNLVSAQSMARLLVDQGEVERSGRIKAQISAAEHLAEVQQCSRQREHITQQVEECSAAVDSLTHTSRYLHGGRLATQRRGHEET